MPLRSKKSLSPYPNSPIRSGCPNQPKYHILFITYMHFIAILGLYGQVSRTYIHVYIQTIETRLIAFTICIS